jgi:hypothetical protein
MPQKDGEDKSDRLCGKSGRITQSQKKRKEYPVYNIKKEG